MEKLHELDVAGLFPEVALQDAEDAGLQQDAIVDRHHAHLQSVSIPCQLLVSSVIRNGPRAVLRQQLNLFECLDPGRVR